MGNKLLLYFDSFSCTIRFFCIVYLETMILVYYSNAILLRCSEPRVHISVTNVTQTHENGWKSPGTKCDLVFCVFTAVRMEH